MKKLISIITLTFCLVSIGYGQEKDIKVYTPQSGDIAFGVDLSPVFNYIGKFFNNATEATLDDLSGTPAHNNLPGLYSITPDVSIMAKYMFNREWGIRANVGLISNTTLSHQYVQDDRLVMKDPFNETKLIDDRTSTNTGGSVMVSAEYRKGKGRVQGVFNAGIIAGAQYTQTNYKYANAITSINQTPTCGFNTYPVYNDNYRLLEKKNKLDIFAGVACGMGVECFVAPKVALGAEVNFTAYYVIGGQTYEISEGFNTSTNKVETRTDLVSPGNDGLYVGIDNIGGSLYMAFYF